jgi:hypothetical protein
MSPLQPFVEWARAVLTAANGGASYVAPASAQMHFSTFTTPPWQTEEGPCGQFTPGFIEPSDHGLQELVSMVVELEMDAPRTEAMLFSKKIVRLVHDLEAYEHWVTSALAPSELIGMHLVLHDVLFELSKKNQGAIDLEQWNPEDRALVDKVLLAVAYVLSWQPYGYAVQFVWTLAKPWYTRLSEVIGIHLDNDELRTVWPALDCIRSRVHHFDALLYGYLEGAGTFNDNEDISISEENMEAVRMFSPVAEKKIIRHPHE